MAFLPVSGNLTLGPSTVKVTAVDITPVVETFAQALGAYARALDKQGIGGSTKDMLIADLSRHYWEKFPTTPVYATS